MEKESWRAIIFYLTEEGNTPKESREKIQNVFGDDAPSYSTVKKYAQAWKLGVTSIFDAEREGRPVEAVTEQMVEKVCDLVRKDRRITIKQIVKELNISVGSVHTILTQELNMSKLSARWIPKMLTIDQKRSRMEICKEHLKEMNRDKIKFFDRIVTQDETWVHHFDPESKQQSMEWRSKGSNPPLKFKKARRVEKVMASIFWDCHGIIMIDYLEKGKTITGKYYADELVKLREQIKEKRRGKLSKGVLLLQDNASSHTSRIATTAAINCGFELLEHPAYSPDLAPSDFYLFPTLKSGLRGHVFTSNEEVFDAVESFFEEKNEEYFKEGIYKLADIWEKCVAIKGDYVEKVAECSD